MRSVNKLKHLPSAEEAERFDVRARPAESLERLVAFAALILVGLTWPLWWGASNYPRVPFCSAAVSVHPACHDGNAILLMVSLLAGILSGTHFKTSFVFGRILHSKFTWLLFLISSTMLVLLDQHRWQPWLWQFWVYAVLFVLAPAGRVIPLARWLVASIYFHSAAGKFDQSFFTTHGPELVDGLLANFGAQLPARGSSRILTAALLPLGECLVAVMLVLRRTRTFGLFLSIAMHLGLMLALGPKGLNHKPGVLVWNAFFIAQNWLLFHSSRTPSTDASEGHFRRSRIAQGFVAVVVLFPFFGWFNLIDPWLGWELYSSRSARVRIEIHESAVDLLPDDLLPFLEPAAPLEEWRSLRIDRWSLAATNAPISPQVRFQVGVALFVAKAFQLDEGIRLQWESTANRRTAQRTRTEWLGLRSLNALAAEFRLNTEPRTNSQARESADH